MSTRKTRGRIAGLAAIGLACAGALAQEGQPIDVKPGERTIEFVPKDIPGEIVRFEIPDWSDPEIARIGEMLVGSYRSKAPVQQHEGDGSAEVWVHIAHTAIEGLPDALYIEAHRADAPDRPYRQSFAQLSKGGGRIHLRTFEPARFVDGLDAYAGFWIIPDQFPPLKREQMIATMDIVLQESPAGVFEGASRHAYPTDLLGAMEMTGAIRFDGQTLAFADRGFDAEGNLVWGPPEGEWIEMVREDYPLAVRQSETGLTILTYPGEFSQYPKDGDSVRFAYTGWLWDSGKKFASSDDDGILPEVTWPVAKNTLNWAWEETVQDMALGMSRRIISPPERAFRARGWPQKGVPPMARIVFHLKLVNIDPPQENAGAGDEDGG